MPALETTRALSDSVAAEVGVATELSTTGGTSDGRFIAVADLEPLARVYEQTFTRLMSN